MIHPKQISEIVHSTLEQMGVLEISIEKLVKATFLMESNLEMLFDHSNKYNLKRGLMLMDDATSKEVMEEYLKFRPVQRNNLAAACLIDLERKTLGDRLNALESNVRFMVGMTYLFYASVYDKAPEDDLHDIASYYFKYYKKVGKGDTDRFIEKYKSTFMNK